MIGYDHLTPTTTDRLHPASSTSTFCVIDFPWSWGNKFLFFFSSFCVWQLQECQIYIYLFVYVCVCLKATPRRRRWGFGGFEQHTTVRQRENIDAITRRPLYRLCSCVPSCAAQSSLMMSVNEPRLFLSFFHSFFFFFFSTVISCTSNLLLFFSLLFFSLGASREINWEGSDKSDSMVPVVSTLLSLIHHLLLVNINSSLLVGRWL